ncbi:hypothetical protein H7J81_18140 [Mycobacterium cookii]|nr:hypothetical protein [Mycobacterium cookii]
MLVSLLRPLAGQACLAHPGFAGDQHGMRTAGQRGLPRGHESVEFAATSDEWAGAGQHCREAGPLQGRLAHLLRPIVVCGFQPQLEDVLGAGQVFELTHPEVGEHDVVGQRVDDEFGGRARAQDLATHCQRPQPRSPVHRPTEVIAVAELDLSGVQRDPDPHRRPKAPLLVGDRVLQLHSGRCCRRRSLEDRERGIALAACLDQPSSA